MTRRSSRLKQLTLFDSFSSPDTSNKAGPSKPSKSAPRNRQPRPQCKTRVQSSEDESSGDTSAGHLESPPSASSLVKVSDDELEECLPRPPAKRRRLATQVLDSDSDLEMKPATPSSHKYSPKLASADEDSASEKLPSRRGRMLKRRRSRGSSEDISDEVDEERILSSRLRSRGKRTTFQKNLDKLKRRMQNKTTSVLSSGDEEDESDDSVVPFEGARPSGEIDSENESSHSDDASNFIVEDDDTVPQLPAQFSMQSHHDLSFQFKKIFQFFVHIAVHAPTERHDYMKTQMNNEEYFSIPLKTTQRKLLGLRDSLVASSVWSPGFKTTLENYPNFEVVPLDFAIPYCDACHLGGRMSTLIGRVSGPPYDRTGFESLVDSEDTDSEEESCTKKEFHLGRFCARRTRVYHEFSHWEYHLFQCINEEIEQLRQSRKTKGQTFYRVAYAGGKVPPEDLNDADELCEWLDERKIIDMEWKKMKTMMDSARHLEMATKKGEED